MIPDETTDLAAQYARIQASLSPAFVKATDEAIHNATWNALMFNGIPATPNAVRTLIGTVMRGSVFTLLVKGLVQLTEAGTATAEEVAAMEEERRQYDEAVRRLTSPSDTDTPDRPGIYL